MGFNKQHIGDNEGMGTGLGGTNLKSLVSGYAWQNAQAETYYNALKTANGGDIDSSSLYSIDLDTYKGAIDTFFVTGNTDGWLAQMVGMYLYQGDNASTQSVNACNTSAFDLIFVNTPTHNKDGLTLDGATQYAKTRIIPSTDLSTTSLHLSSFVNNFTGGSNRTLVGCYENNDKRLNLIYVNASTSMFFDCFSSTLSRTSNLDAVSGGFYMSSRRASNDVETYIDGVTYTTASTSGGTIPTVQLYIGANNSSGTPGSFTDTTFGISTIGNGLTDAQQLSLYNAYTVFANALGRTYTFTNATASTYYSALKTANGGVDIDSETIYGINLYLYKASLDRLFERGNKNGWLALTHALYLFQGDNASTQAINGKNSGTFDLTFINTPTYGSGGVTLDGATQYAQTGYIPNTDATLNNSHLSAYMTGLDTNVTGFYMGANTNPATDQLSIFYSGSTNKFLVFDAYNNNSSQGRALGITTGLENTFVVGSRLASNDSKLYSNATQDKSINTSGGPLTSKELYVGARNGNGVMDLPLTGTMQIASIGLGLSGAQVTSYYNDYNVFKTKIGR